MGLREAILDEDEPIFGMMTVRAAREALWAKLAEGSIVATGIDQDDRIVQIAAYEWPYLTLEADSNLRDRVTALGRPRSATYRNLNVRRIDVVAIWPEPAEKPQPSPFVLEEELWTFLEAATWVGCKGRVLSSREIADGDLEEKGAHAIFRALHPRRDLVATGLNRQRLREVIPAEYWEMATMDPEAFHEGEGHFFSFVDTVLGEDGGQLTPVGDHQPRWFGIRIERDALFAAFPEIAGAPSQGAPARPPLSSESPKAQGVLLAIRTLYPSGIPVGLTSKARLVAVNEWLKNQGHSEVSARTVARVLEKLVR
jgi:hypothetical protein